MSVALCFHCKNNKNNNQAMDLIEFKQIHKQTYEAVCMPVSWHIKKYQLNDDCRHGNERNENWTF